MRRIVVGVVLAWLLVAAAPAHAAGIVIGADGETAEAFGYTDAIREHVNIPVSNLDQDGNGFVDQTAIDIIRPAASGPGFKVPAIIDPSPYYTTIGRGNEVQTIADKDGDGLNDVWPLFVDNYFVPRGYAVILADMDGTGHSSGCPLQGGPGDIASMKAVIDWLNGRILGFDNFGNPVAATWHNGKAAMIGKSYDGTLANGVAATGVPGLTTIVDESGISDWYGYSRMGGVRFSSVHYPSSLSLQITNRDRQATCAFSRTALNEVDGDATGDVNSFWEDRDYLPDVGNVRASVFVSHGINDDNVRMDQMARWWEGLAAHDVPRKLWLSQEGHVDPFDYRRAQWVDTLHRWFDHWLWGIDNGIMSEPRVDIETSSDHWQTYADWPLPGTSDVDVMLHGTDPTAAGSLAVGDAGSDPGDSLQFTDNASGTRSPFSEDQMIASPDTLMDGRLAFLSPPLSHDVHISGTPVVALHASLNTTQSNLAAILVDYGDGQQVDRNNEGITTNFGTAASSCWGESSTYDSACFDTVSERVINASVWRITHGLLDSSNRDSLTTPTPVNPGQEYTFGIPLIATDYDVPAGHRIGVVLMANDTRFPLWGSVAGTVGATVTVDTHASKVVLPVVGGDDAAVKAFDVTGPTARATVSGGAGWAEGPRTATLQATDEPGGSGVLGMAWSKTGAETADPVAQSGSIHDVDVAAEGVTTIHFHGIDNAGNSGPEQTVDVKIDESPPVVSCAAPDGSWHAADVSLACTASDAGSGLADAGDAAFSLSTHVPAGQHDGNAATGSRTVCDALGHCATVGPIAGNKVDLKPPTATAVVSGGDGWEAGPRTVTLRGTDEPGGSGVASITWSLRGATKAEPRTVDHETVAIPLTADGVTTVAYHATDVAGNAGSERTLAVKVDATRPMVECDVPDQSWHTLNVGLRCAASDDESGLASAGDAAFELSTHVPSGARDVNAATDSRRVCDAVGNCITAGPIVGNRIDLVTPTPTPTPTPAPKPPHHAPKQRKHSLAGAMLSFPRTVTPGHPFLVHVSGPRRRASFTLELRRHGHVVATTRLTLGHRHRTVRLRTRRLKPGTATLYVTAKRHGHRVGRFHVRLPVRGGAKATALLVPTAGG